MEGKTIFEKICAIMDFEVEEGITAEEVIQLRGYTAKQIPEEIIVDIVYKGSLGRWAASQNVDTERKLAKKIERAIRKTVNSIVLADRATNNKFMAIQNFYSYCSNVSRRDDVVSEAEKIAESVWNEELAVKRLDERIAEMFKEKPCKNKYNEAAIKLKDIWGFSDTEIEGFRYFVCQSRNKFINPSLNKSLYIYSLTKKTGKTSVSRALISILNGETCSENAGKYESSLAIEMQYNDYAKPVATEAKAVLCEESMPKDSSKAYGQIKAMLTGNSVKYNQKYGKIVNLPARRHYIFTSNEDPSDFIQDGKERRFIPIHMKEEPKQISFEKIFNVWKQFATNCEPESDWQIWYNSFDDVDGLMSKDIEYYKAKLLTTNEIHNELQQMTGTYVSTGFFHDRLAVGKATRDEKKAINESCEELFGKQPYPSKWRVSDVNQALSDKVSYMTSDYEEEEVKQLVKGLPF